MDCGYFLRRFEGTPTPGDPDRPAVTFDMEATLSHRLLGQNANRVANALLERGVKRGDRVGLLLFNCLEYVPLYLAVMRIGAIAVRLNFRLSPDEIRYALRDSGCMMLFFHPALAGTVASVRSEATFRWAVCLAEDEAIPDYAMGWQAFLSEDTAPPQVERPAGGAPAMLMYTSGTTGRPKGAVWTHDNTLWFAAIQGLKWGYGPDTVAMTTGPMYHVGAVEDLLSAAIAAGGHGVTLKSGGFDIRRVVTIVNRHAVTDLMLFPYMVYQLVRDPDFETMDLSSVRRIVSGGDPVLPWAIERLEAHHPHIEFVQIYGLTEGSPVAACSTNAESRRRPDAVGRPMPFTEISLRDDDGRPVSEDAEGEVWIRNPVVAAGYWNRPEATAETFVDGWMRSGDLGRLTDCGLLMISGRKKDMIRSGGENIYPREIEDALVRHEAVEDAAVIAVPDPDFLEAVCAVIVPAAGTALTAEMVIDWARQHLASYKKPRHVVFTDQIPRTPSGKIQKYLLRERYRTLGDPPTVTNTKNRTREATVHDRNRKRH